MTKCHGFGMIYKYYINTAMIIINFKCRLFEVAIPIIYLISIYPVIINDVIIYFWEDFEQKKKNFSINYFYLFID